MRVGRVAFFAALAAAALSAACTARPTPPALTVTETVTASASTRPTTALTTTTTTPAAPVPEGQEVRDGDFAFSVEGGAAFVRDQALYADVLVTMRNVGARPATFDARYQTLVDKQGREYSMYEASSTEYKPSDVFQLNPGLTAHVLLMYKLPVDFESWGVVCRGSMNSTGAALAAIFHRTG